MPTGIYRHPKGSAVYNWKGDAATVGTKRNRAQRAFPLSDCEDCGTRATDRHHIDGDTGNNVRSNIAILCRRCHMKRDGRLEAFRKNGQLNKVRLAKPASPCLNCGKIAKPLRKGLCHRCSDYFRSHGQHRPKIIGNLPNRKAFAIQSPCPICGRITRLKTKGRCVVCYNYFKLQGKDRRKFSFRVSDLTEENRNARRKRIGR